MDRSVGENYCLLHTAPEEPKCCFCELFALLVLSIDFMKRRTIKCAIVVRVNKKKAEKAMAAQQPPHRTLIHPINKHSSRPL